MNPTEKNNGVAPVTGNVYDKYSTQNPLYRRLMARFLRQARAYLAQTQAHKILEVGCGAGELAANLLEPPEPPAAGRPDYTGIDIGDDEILQARQRLPGRNFLKTSVYTLPFADDAFDCVIACEVLEHLEQPEAGLAEIARVASRYLIASVPDEPMWRLLNLARGKYLAAAGNTPGHVQHFSFRAFQRLLAGRFKIVHASRPWPWCMALAVKEPCHE